MNSRKLASVSAAVRSVMEQLEPRQLLSGTLTLVNPDSLPSSDRLIFNTIEHLNPTVPNVVHDSQPLTLEDTGIAQLTITSLTVSGPFELVNAPQTPIVISPGQPLTLTLEFTQTSLPPHAVNETNYTTDANGGAAITGSLTIDSSDTVTPTKVVTLAGYWQYESENNNEPNLTTITNLLAGYDTQINPGSSDPDLPNGATTADYYGQEVYSASWAAADPSEPVTVTQLAAFHTEGNIVHTYWYSASTEASHLLLTSQANQGQTLLPTLPGGGLMTASFTPTGAFGLRVDDEYSDDAINVANGNQAGSGHHFRFYPVVDEHGNLVPNTWIVAMDYAVIQTENFDFNDNVFIVSNITPNNAPTSPTGLSATNGAQPVLTWNAVNYSGGLAGYNVYRATNPAGPYTKLTASAVDTNVTYTDTTAPAGSTLYYEVTAVSTAAAPNESAPATTTANTPAGITAANYTIDAYSGQLTTINVLANDSDGDGTINPASLTAGSALHGTTALDINGGVIDYTSTTGFTGTDTFTYTIHDNNSNSASGTVTVDVSNTATSFPIANNDSAVALENTPVVIDVLANDEPVTTFNLASVTIGTAATRGDATVNSDGTITYTPTTNDVGQDTFTYTVADGNGEVSGQATVTVNVGVEINSTLKTANHSIVYTDDNGTTATITLNRGIADVYFGGIGTAPAAAKNGRVTLTNPSDLSISSVALSDTTVASSLQIHSPGNKGSITLNGITDTGVLGSINAPIARLIGTVGANTVDLGGARSISVKLIQLAEITVGSQLTGKTSLTSATTVTDSDFTSSMPVSLLKAASWTNSSHNILEVSASSIATLSIAGEFDPDLDVTGNITSAHIVGPLGFGVWTVGGNVSSLYAGSVGSTWGGADVTGKIASMIVHTGGLASDVSAATINSLSIIGNLTANVTAGTAKLIHVTGAVSGSTISLSTGGNSLGTLLVGGQISDSTVNTAGNIVSLVAASLSGATITAGNTQSLSSVLPSNIGTASINNLVLTTHVGFAFADSTVIAAKILSATLHTVNTDNSSVPEGLGLGALHSIVFIENGDTQHLNSKSTARRPATLKFLM